MREFFFAIHLLFILFLTSSFPLGLYYNNRKFRLIHASLVIVVTLLIILQIPCPLTVLEEWVSGVSYGGSFIATRLNQIIYLAWFNPKTVFWLDMTFGALVLSSFLWRPIKK